MTHNEKILLVDVGGTSLDIYEYMTSCNSCKLINQLKTKDIDVNQWVNCLGRTIYNTNYQQIILGIPGDVTSKDNKVFCPPLGKTIIIKTIKENGIKVVNDMKIQPFLIGLEKSTQLSDKLILNSGTSVGLCIVDSKFFETSKLSYIKSFEFAHEFLNKFGKSQALYKLISQNANYKCRKFCSIYSVGGYAAAQGIKVKITEEGMLRIEKNEFKDYLKNKKLKSSITSLWISSLQRDLKNFLITNYNFTSNPTSMIRGGLKSALGSSPQGQILNSFNVYI